MKQWKVKRTETRVIRWYRLSLLGTAAVLLIIAGMITFVENSQYVLQENRVVMQDVYPFSFLSQERGVDGQDGVKTDSDEVYYSDSFFGRDNDKYDHELARASLALSMTAFKQEHVSELLDALGFTAAVFYRYDQQNDDDKTALALAHKYINGDPVIAVVVRGGKYGDEWGSNGRVGYEGEAFGYHYGFHSAAADAVVQLKEYAADNDLDLRKTIVWITGFSRGAAVSNVMGAMLLGEAAGKGGASGDTGTVSPENMFGYTFASPSTVSEDLVAAKVTGLYNVVNPLDIVTRLPMNAAGTSKTSGEETVRYNWDYTKYGTTLNLPSESKSAQMQVVRLLENALAFATRDESQYVERIQDTVIIPALKKTMGKGADLSKRNVGFVLVDSLPGVTTFLKNEVDRLDLVGQVYVAGLLAGKKNLRLEKEHWPETYWGWMVKVDALEQIK